MYFNKVLLNPHVRNVVVSYDSYQQPQRNHRSPQNQQKILIRKPLKSL